MTRASRDVILQSLSFNPAGLAIDVGTTNTVVYVGGVGVVLAEPTIEWTPQDLTFWPECFSYSAEIDGTTREQDLWGERPKIRNSTHRIRPIDWPLPDGRHLALLAALSLP
ncbi:MAG: hypothetical protein EOP69_00390 [Spirochaetia bacterium]|nr:MAG: hypothetical protein EOP69_00390 [Spirochaetia bacterium]